MTPLILIVDDEPAMRRGLVDNLQFEGYRTEEAVDGLDALNKIKSVTFDLVILDIMMPNLSGLEVCKQVRASGNAVPIILLTAKGEEIDKVLGLELGADDYVQKPFSIRELMARVKAVLRRSVKSDTAYDGDVRIGELLLNFKKYTASRGDLEEKLSHKEFEILNYLYQHPNEVVDRYELLKNVWEYSEDITTRTVDNFIAKLRQKVEVNPTEPRIILTIHGRGYKLILDK
jgi:DNA-binding response OmpR family regulator